MRTAGPPRAPVTRGNLRIVKSAKGNARRARWVAPALGLCVASVAPHRAKADIYTFTDKDGVVHFANKPGSDGRYTLYIRSKERKPGTVSVAPSDTSLERFTRYDTWIRQAATLYQIPEELIRAVIKCESDYDPRAVSSTGAQGLMQLMPETALRMQVRDAFDPRENIFGGTRYLRILANNFNGDLALTVAGYNAGEGAVVKHQGIPPYAETQQYVTHVSDFYRQYRSTRDTVRASLGY